MVICYIGVHTVGHSLRGGTRIHYKMLSLYLILFLIVTISTLIKIITDFRRQKQLTASLPEWRLIPFVGTFFIKNTAEYFDCIVEAAKVAEEDRDGRFRTWVGTKFFIMTTNMDDIKKIVNNLIEKPVFYNFTKIWLGNGLLTAPAELWKKNIKLLSGTFGLNVVDGFHGIFNAQARKLVKQLKAEVGKPPFDAFHDFFGRFTFETICQTALQVSELESLTTTEQFEAINAVSEHVTLRFFNIFHHSDFLYKLSSDYRNVMKHIGTINKLSRDIIDEKRKERLERKQAGIPENESIKGKTFLDLLLTLSETNPCLTDEQIQSEINTIIFGGQETNAVALNFIFLCLGSHPQKQEKLYAEIHDIFGDSDRDVTKDDFPKMVYTEAIIHETMRLFPTIPAIMRYADKDLEMDGYTIPKGTSAIISIWGMGRSKKIWGKDADEFIPERWLEPSKMPFIPFSYGRRACIGKKYSYALLKIAIGWIVRELKFKSDIGHIKLKSDIALKPYEGNLVEVQMAK